MGLIVQGKGLPGNSGICRWLSNCLVRSTKSFIIYMKA